MNIHRAAPSDASSIAALVRSFEALLVEDPSAAVPFWESMSERAHAANIASDRFVYYIAETDKRFLGFIAMRDDTHLFNLFVERPSQGLGVARALLQHAVRQLPSHARTASITVNASLNAVPAYEAFGFRAVGEIVRQHGIAFLPMRWDRTQKAG